MPRATISRTVLCISVIACVIALPACQRAGEALAETAIERASGDQVDIDHNGDTVNIKTDAGDVKIATASDGGSVALPADFPSDVFLPEQRTVSSAMDIGGMKAVNMATEATLPDLSTDVEKTMQAQGWKREMSMQTSADSATLIYTKDKRQAVYQLIKAEDGGTQLAVRTGGEG